MLIVFIFLALNARAATDVLYSADFLLTYDQMPNAGVSGTMVYDLAKRSLAFRFATTGSSEIYLFNQNLGYGSQGQYDDQYVWKIVPNSACSPCTQYSNTKGFPFTNNSFNGGWASSVLIPPAIKGRFGSNQPSSTDSNGCTRYDAPQGSWASYFGIKGNDLCYLADTNGRLFTLSGPIRTTYNASWIEPPTGCKCLLPVDIAISLDRSSSISTKSTYYYNAFMKAFANSFYFNASDPSNTAQLSITQWGGTFWPLTSIGNLNFTSNIDNIKTASSVVGCTSKSSDCQFCYNCDNKKRTEEDEAAQGQGTCSNPKKPPKNSSDCTYGESTCTACGIYGMTDQFARQTYMNRSTATKLAIVITDGRSNTPYPGNPSKKQGDCEYDSDQQATRTQKIGCYLDITNARQNLLSKVPGVITYAIGVGGDYSLTTLDRISGSRDRSFDVSTFEDLLANLQKFVLGFCPLPNPVTECGSCCGFCQCGICLPPDTPLPSAFCDENNYVLSDGNCFIKPVKKINPPCPQQPCKTSTCSNTTMCTYQDQCEQGQPGISECFDYLCAQNVSTGFYSCQPSRYLCGSNETRSPTSAPTSPAPIDETQPTGAPTTSTPCQLGCGEFGDCDLNQTSCICRLNYTGVLCGLPPGIDVCQNDTDCFINLCVESQCVIGEGGGKICLTKERDCNDGSLCTIDTCSPSEGCLHVKKFCNDGLQCTDDACNETTGECFYKEPDCSFLDDECHTSYCNNYAENINDRCQKEVITCARDGNCSISECRIGDGCVNEVYSCGVAYYGAVVAAAVVAGATVAAVAACILIGASVAGGGYAVSRNMGMESDAHVHTSPLYKPQGKVSNALG